MSSNQQSIINEDIMVLIQQQRDKLTQEQYTEQEEWMAIQSLPIFRPLPELDEDES